MTVNDLSATFKALHTPGKPIVLTNVWDVLSAGTIARLPRTRALATASYAVAMAHGTEDNDLTLQQNLSTAAYIAPIAQKSGIPLSVDLQDGYGDRLEEAVSELIDLGVAGINLEDVDKESQTQYSISRAVERVKRALSTAQAKGVPDFVINARCDTLVVGGTIEDAVMRGKRYLAAGATTVFIWGGRERGTTTEEVRLLVKEFNGRLNVSLKQGGLSVQELTEIGVARISIGPRLLFPVLETIRREADLLLK